MPNIESIKYPADTEIVRVIGGRHMGKTLALVHLLEDVMREPGHTVYVNFELPKWAQETISKYATIEKTEDTLWQISNQLSTSPRTSSKPSGRP